MKKLLIFFLCIFSVVGVVFADESEYILDTTFFSETEQISTSEAIVSSSSDPIYYDDPDLVQPTDLQFSDNIVSSIKSVVSPVTPSNSNGFKSALVSILGNYDPVIVEYQYQSSNGYYSYLREVQPDYVWLCSAAILLVVLYCLFRLAGGIFSGKR